jgi:hypothetical protein
MLQNLILLNRKFVTDGNIHIESCSFSSIWLYYSSGPTEQTTETLRGRIKMHIFVRITLTVSTAILWVLTRFNPTCFTDDMEDAMSRLRHGTAEAWVQSLACLCGICGEQFGTGTVSLRALHFPLSVKCSQCYTIIYSSIIDSKQFTVFKHSVLTFWHRNLTFKFEHTLYVKCE